MSAARDYYEAGGISGYSKGTIIGCISVWDNIAITKGGMYAGGIAGYNSGTVADSSVKNLEMSGNWSHKGGIIGYNAGNNTNNIYTGTLNQIGN